MEAGFVVNVFKHGKFAGLYSTSGGLWVLKHLKPDGQCESHSSGMVSKKRVGVTSRGRMPGVMSRPVSRNFLFFDILKAQQ